MRLIEDVCPFEECEEKDGIRFSWNPIPRNKVDYFRVGFPTACLYTPLKNAEEIDQLKKKPTFCTCGAILNPFW